MLENHAKMYSYLNPIGDFRLGNVFYCNLKPRSTAAIILCPLTLDIVHYVVKTK